MEPPSFRWDSDAPEHIYCETLDPLEKTLAFPSTPLYGRRKGVAQWNFLFGCVRVGHRYMENTIITGYDKLDPVYSESAVFTYDSTHLVERKCGP